MVLTVLHDPLTDALTEGQSDFEALQNRVHPAASRVHLLAERTPAHYMVFDLLAADGDDLRAEPYARRRARLAELLADAPPTVRLTPATTEVAQAERWLRPRPGSGVDGVVAKDPAAAYEPGRRTMTKIKLERTADCVVAGFRLTAGADAVSSLLLGLYDGDGALRHVGVVTSFPAARRVELLARLAPYATALPGHPWERGFGLEGGPVGRLKGSAGRWTPDLSQDWVPLRPELVCEVAYDRVEGLRWRHPARFVRWRPDRDARSCGVRQLLADA